MIVRTDDQLRVVCLEGRAELRVPGQAVVRVAPQTMANLSASRVRSEKVDFLPRYTSWMTRLIVRQEDQAEREGLVKRMVEHYFGDEFRDEARAELRKLGSAAVMPMIQGLEARPNLDARFQLQTARLICRALAGPDNILQLFYLLKSRVPEVRVLAYETIYEKTDDSYGTGDAFWRAEGAAAENERRIVIDEWFEHEKRK